MAASRCALTTLKILPRFLAVYGINYVINAALLRLMIHIGFSFYLGALIILPLILWPCSSPCALSCSFPKRPNHGAPCSSRDARRPLAAIRPAYCRDRRQQAGWARPRWPCWNTPWVWTRRRGFGIRQQRSRPHPSLGAPAGNASLADIADLPPGRICFCTMRSSPRVTSPAIRWPIM